MLQPKESLMNLRFVIAIASLFFAAAAFAHNSPEHEFEPAKPKPATCEQYADRATYSNDLADPKIKALKDQCDAAKKSTDAAKDESQDEKQDD
jgi:hypothetical protein